MSALAMVGEDFDHAAISNMPVPAAINHQLQLGLEGSEAADTLLNLS